MLESFVKIVQLPSMRVASFHSMGEHLGDPERKAYAKMMAWAQPQGLLDNPAKHPVFGFNNPDPPLSKEGLPEPTKPYGYEFWVRISAEQDVDEKVNTKTVEGGLFGVMTCRVEGPVDPGKTWGQLITWIQKSKAYAFHPKWKGLKSHYDKEHVEHGTTGLEHHLNPMEPPPKGKPWKTKECLIIDIYAPIMET